MFKAHPINKKIFEAPAEVAQNQRKKSTVPKPFNITKTKKVRIAIFHQGYFASLGTFGYKFSSLKTNSAYRELVKAQCS